jgi:Fic family protein
MLNKRQTKAIQKMFTSGIAGFQGDMTGQKYKTITSCSKETATRDLQKLANYGRLEKLPASVRSTRYKLMVLRNLHS